jgi:hypothetical protein
VLRKFFPRDKNYILEEAQLSLQQELLQYLVDFVRVEYLLRSNPLGISDDTSKRIELHTSTEFSHLDEFYLNLAGVYRFTHYSDSSSSMDGTTALSTGRNGVLHSKSGSKTFANMIPSSEPCWS